jgi:hypothetical protein
MKSTAAGLAALGRGPDSMLVHMSPREVQGLQQLAMAHGGSLTINPHTGLPEAGFLDKMLPTIIGAGLMLIPGMQPWAAGLITGGIQTARTGDIGKGIMAGLGAYGGAGLGSALGGMGQAAAQQTALASAQPAIQAEAASLGMMPSEIGAEMAAGFKPVAQQTALAGAQNAPVFGSQNLGNMVAGAKQIGQPGGLSQFGTALGQQFPTKMSQAAAGVGALNAMGGFEQPGLRFTPPQEAPVNYRKQLANVRPYDPERNLYTDYGIVQPVYAAKGGSLDMKDGGFVVPADVVSHLGNGDTDAGLAVLANKTGARPIKGKGDGMSDSIRASVNRTQPARVASGEAYIDREQVAQLGNGDQKRGSKKLYAMMDKVRKARTGTAKQGRQINADRFVPA